MVPMRADLEVLQGDHSRRLDDSQGAFILPIVDGVISGQYFAPFNTLVSPPFRLSMCSAQRVYPWARFPINSSAQPQSPKNAPRFTLIVLAHNNRRYEHPLASGPGPIRVWLCRLSCWRELRHDGVLRSSRIEVPQGKPFSGRR
jgi:hypothetical protein